MPGKAVFTSEPPIPPLYRGVRQRREAPAGRREAGRVIRQTRPGPSRRGSLTEQSEQPLEELLETCDQPATGGAAGAAGVAGARGIRTHPARYLYRGEAGGR